MNGGQTMVVIIVAIVMIASIVRAKYGYSRSRRRDGLLQPQGDSPETLRLRDEVKQLKDRLHVLERIAVDKENSLANEIESLRDR